MSKHQTDNTPPPERTPLQPGDLRRMASEPELGLAADFLAEKVQGNRNAGMFSLIEGVETGVIDAAEIRRLAATQRAANQAADAALLRELMA